MKTKIFISIIFLTFLISFVNGALLPAPSELYESDLTTDSFEANWNSVANAYSYRVELSLTLSPFTPIASADIFNNYYWFGSPSLSSDTQYYWRVRAIGHGDYESSPFIYKGVTTLAEDPNRLDEPEIVFANSITSSSFKTYLTWETNADIPYSIHTQLASDENFNNILAGDSITLNSELVDTYFNAINPSGLSSSTGYYWRVRFCKTGYECSFWVERLTITLEEIGGVLDTPEGLNNQNILEDEFELHWEEVENANSYYVEVYSDSLFTNLIASGGTVLGNTYIWFGSNPLINEDSTYYWRVRAIGEGEFENSEWANSSVNTLDEDITKLETPFLTSPPLIEKYSISLNWNSVLNADEYLIQSSENYQFTSLMENKTLSNSEYNFSDLESYTYYYFRIKAIGEGFNDSNYFQILLQTKGELQLSKPNNLFNSEISSKGFKANWEQVTNADYYTLNILEEDCSTLLIVEETENPYKVFSSLENNTRYCWAVQANAESYSDYTDSEWEYLFIDTSDRKILEEEGLSYFINLLINLFPEEEELNFREIALYMIISFIILNGFFISLSYSKKGGFSNIFFGILLILNFILFSFFIAIGYIPILMIPIIIIFIIGLIYLKNKNGEQNE